MSPISQVFWQLHKIPHFLAVAESGSIHRAAESLRIAQPALGKSIAVLESSLGFPLFIRGRQGSRLTQKGEILFNFAKDLRKDVESLERSFCHNRLHEVRLCTHELLVPQFFARLSKQTELAKKGIKFHLSTEVSSSKMIRCLKNDVSDFAVCVEGAPQNDLKRHLIFRDSYQCFADSGLFMRFPQLATPGVSLEQISDCAPLIYSPNVTVEKETSFGEWLESERYFFQGAIKVSSIESVCALTNEGLGVGILPVRFSSHLRSQNIKKLVADFRSKQSIGELRLFAYFREKETSWIFASIIAELRSHFSSKVL